jgi:5-methylcytosine-specific restriction enzyme A
MRENYHIGTTLTKQEWINVLLDREISTDIDIAILQAMYSFEGHKAAASQIGLILGFKGKNTSSLLNLEMGRWGKRLVKKYPVRFTIRENGTERKWDIFFDGWGEDKLFIWQIKKELIEALEATNLTGDEQFPEELPIENQVKIIEGAKRTITVNSYERNSKARQLCISYYGTICQVCGFDFEMIYGKLGKDFIHVHHLTKVADIGIEYEVKPIQDLRPVCPNCHAMLHRKEPPLRIDELKEILTKQR